MAIFYKGQRLAHLNKWEAYIWSKWLKKHIDEYFGYTYDVHVGTTTKTPKDWSDNYKRDVAALSRKRIDVVMEDIDSIYIVEVKDRAYPECLGRIITYRDSYIDTYNPDKPIKIILVATYIDPDLRRILDGMGIRYFIE